MPASSIVKNFQDGSLLCRDGSATPRELEADLAMGDLSLSGLAQGQREVTAYETRGELKSLRKTTRKYPTGSFSLMLADLSDISSETLIDFLLRQGAYETNVSTTEAIGDVYTVDLELTINGSELGDPDDHVITLHDCHCALDLAEGDPNKVTVNFTVYGDVEMS